MCEEGMTRMKAWCVREETPSQHSAAGPARADGENLERHLIWHKIAQTLPETGIYLQMACHQNEASGKRKDADVVDATHGNGRRGLKDDEFMNKGLAECGNSWCNISRLWRRLCADLRSSHQGTLQTDHLYGER